MKAELSPEIAERIKEYPPAARDRLKFLLVRITATALALGKESVTQALKWGEPSFVVSGGTPVRFGWNPSFPDSVFLYVHCSSRIIDTLREVTPGLTTLHGNRAIELPINLPWPESDIDTFLTLALDYHQRKHLPLLGL
ncbi:DUF1801 domain-containing protein [Shewanella corallii]|uniref:DUF1801 domain-containing protein n=1 Tax=Shewanella corallii TaxID=560080 RepID=A0ABT0N2J8_9GAMM|nr:DUF1801 domain-containing protein [Shewanella corallii]MCL2912666.1 DUF1801 domain-containing protein [Shewanella corallii]